MCIYDGEAGHPDRHQGASERQRCAFPAETKLIRGDHYVTLVVQVPTKLNEDAKEALRRFDTGDRQFPESEVQNPLLRQRRKKKQRKKAFSKKALRKLKETFEDRDE